MRPLWVSLAEALQRSKCLSAQRCRHVVCCMLCCRVTQADGVPEQTDVSAFAHADCTLGSVDVRIRRIVVYILVRIMGI